MSKRDRVTVGSIVLVLFVIALAALDAFAATDPVTEQPVLRLQKPKESKTRCILKMTTQRYFIRSDGRMEYAGGFTIWQACDR